MRRSLIYKTEERERLGLRLAMTILETVVAEPSAKVTLERLLEWSRLQSKLEVLVMWLVAPDSMTQGSWVVRQVVEVPWWAKVAVELDPTELECIGRMQWFSSLGIETTLDDGGSDCEGCSSIWKLAH